MSRLISQQQFYEYKLEYEIDSWDLYEALGRGDNIQVIDVRTAEAYEISHIPGSINIPHRIMDKKSTSHLDKETMYVCYCDGIGCNGSTKGSLNMTLLGFRVKELMGGLDWWLRDGYETHGTQASTGREIVCGC
jgi:rhodanese-related sulfurtransferase